MNTSTSPSRPADVDAEEHEHRTPPGPEGWPLTLQVALAFCTVTIAVIAHGASGGALCPGLLAAIAIDYAVYLRTDGGAIVALLTRAPWNNDRDAPVAPTGALQRRVRITDLSVRETVSFAREEIGERAVSARAALAGMTPDRKAHLLRAAAAAAGVMVTPVHPALGVAIVILAGLDALLHARLGVSAAALPFEDEGAFDGTRGQPDVDAPLADREAPASPTTDDSNLLPWRNAA